MESDSVPQVQELLLELIKLPKEVDSLVSGLAEECHNLEAELEAQSIELNQISQSLEIRNRELQSKRFVLFSKFRKFYNQFTEEYLEYVSKAKFNDELCKDTRYKIDKNVCDQAREILEEHESIITEAEELLSELKASNLEFDEFLSLVNQNGGSSFADNIKERDIFYKNSEGSAFTSVLEENMNEDVQNFKSFINGSIDTFKEELTNLDKESLYSKHRSSLIHLAKSPMNLIYSDEINLRLISRSERLLNLSEGQALVTFNTGDKLSSFALNSNNIAREFESQTHNSTQAFIHHRKVEDELKLSMEKHGAPYSVSGIKDKLSEYAWVRDFVQSYHENGVSGVPSSALKRACRKAKEITGQSVCRYKNWKNDIEPFLRNELYEKQKLCSESATSLRDS